MTAPLIKVEEVELYERDVVLRLPFRFGVVTLREAPQAFARIRVSLEDGRSEWGVAAEVLAPKWFDKDESLTNEDNFDQLRTSIALARKAFLNAGRVTAFGLPVSTHHDHVLAARLKGLKSLVASYGPALLNKAVMDALCKLHNVSFYQAIKSNMAGILVDEMTPDLKGFDLDAFLASLTPAKSIHARHTVGMIDPLVAADQNSADRVNDGLPETLEEIVHYYGHTYFKIKVGGDIDADITRLTAIAGVLDKQGGDYHLSLDGNEQYEDAAGVVELLDAMDKNAALKNFNANILFIEQPIKRAMALKEDVGAIAARYPVIIDESDGSFDAFPEARLRGYRGVSSKTCKGFYKSILNTARTRCWSEEEGPDKPDYFMSAEDLTIQAGPGLQQDLALINLLGLTHVERNGHHYVHGMTGAGAPKAEQEAFAAAHPSLYRREGDETFVRIEDGLLDLQSLDCPGFASGAEPDWSSMREMKLDIKDFS
ncbi:MAG: mandelate racemase [Alphaproteobacteria bacterium]|jgi:hypothetical protein|nr:mandelate racemase [Alphaproteobacteria bacterium]MBT4018109.1 mandelate racemase [Alphaproteobacteria bacterium]MBT4965731.1 mandelate racemase [Alphaproteobacteria bacterium]MBT5158202.1 mandelate racemase [Alphaproteobacteria bacterium]MBT5919357.1 mandelate racemase [Alphaproteobacteria bacterium]